MSPIDMGRPMKIPMDGGMSMGAPPPPPEPPPMPPPPEGGNVVQVSRAPSGEFLVSDGGGAPPQPIGDMGSLIDFLQSQFGGDEAPAGPPPPPPGPGLA